jgi:mRNA-degrading endonuclease toxin of MazEF toxin-antitoxin module
LTNGLTRDSKALVDIIMPIDKDYRLQKKLGYLEAAKMTEID